MRIVADASVDARVRVALRKVAEASLDDETVEDVAREADWRRGSG